MNSQTVQVILEPCLWVGISLGLIFGAAIRRLEQGRGDRGPDT